MQQLTNVQANIETVLNQYGEVVLTRNNKNNIIVMSMEEYKKNMIKREIIEKLKQSEKEIENGEGMDIDIAFKELRQKYGY